MLLDAAHNPHGAEAAAAALDDSFVFSPLIGVIGVMGDKDAEGLLAAFEPHLAHVVCTQNSTSRAMPAETLAVTAREVFGDHRVTVEPRLADAIDQAAALAEAGEAVGESIGSGAVLVTGSVVTVGRGPHAAAGPSLMSDAERRIAAEPPPVQERSPRRGMCAAVLSLEAITLGLTTPVMITISDVAVGTALAVGLGLAVGCLVVAGMLRARVGLRARLGAADRCDRTRPGGAADVLPRLAVRAALGHGVLPGPQDRPRARRGVRRGQRPVINAGS